MSITNEYTIQLLAKQRHADLIAEAANDRLVRIARSGRPSLRQRILGGVNRTGAERLTHTSRPAQVH